MRMQYLAKVAIASLTMILPFAVNAGDYDYYAGISFGKSENNTAAAKIGIAGGGTNFTGSLDNKDSAWKVVFGYPLWDQYVAVEVSYIDLGKTHADTATSTGTEEIKTFTFGAAGYIPVVSKLGAILHIGFSRNDSKITNITSGTGTFSGATDFEFYWGAGLQYDFAKNFAARVELERFSVRNWDVNLRTAGLLYRF